MAEPPSARSELADDADHILTEDRTGTLCGAPLDGRNYVGRTVGSADGCWMCISNYRAEVGW